MKVPKGMKESEVLEVINKICDRYAYKFKFGYYTPDDIRQEAFIIALDALERYEEGRPLENFLAVHVKNRLNNFKRDKYYRQNQKKGDDKQEKLNNSKRYLMDTLDISNIRDEKEKSMRLDNSFIENIANKSSHTCINLTPYQALETSGARDILTFSIGNDHFIGIAQLAKDMHGHAI